MTPWGEALEILRARKGLSKGDLVRALGMERSQYYRTCVNAKNGPGVSMLNRIFRAMGCTWMDWGEVFHKVMLERHVATKGTIGLTVQKEARRVVIAPARVKSAKPRSA